MVKKIIFLLIFPITLFSQNDSKVFLKNIHLKIGIQHSSFEYDFIGWWAHMPPSVVGYQSLFIGLKECIIHKSKYSFFEVSMSQNILIDESVGGQGTEPFDFSQNYCSADFKAGFNFFFYTLEANKNDFFIGPTFQVEKMFYFKKSMPVVLGWGVDLNYKQMGLGITRQYFLHPHFINSEEAPRFYEVSICYTITNPIRFKK